MPLSAEVYRRQRDFYIGVCQRHEQRIEKLRRERDQLRSELAVKDETLDQLVRSLHSPPEIGGV